jgi:phosphatidylserine decarboxylase
MSLAASIRVVVAPPHKAGWPFIGAGLAAALLGLIWLGWWLFWLGLAAAAFCAYFFRDPTRHTPSRPGVLVAPADGHVTLVDLAAPPPELGLGDTPRWRVAIFLSVLDVHINRAPCEGTITRVAYRHGKFLNASLDKASEDNERNALAMRLPGGQDLAVVQIAGLIARRILCFVNEGTFVAAGERFGLIRFGSRTDLYLPHGVEPLVSLGQTMIGGETVVAVLESAPS